MLNIGRPANFYISWACDARFPYRFFVKYVISLKYKRWLLFDRKQKTLYIYQECFLLFFDFMTIIIRYNEIGLKGKNRDWFEKKLVQNIKNKIKKENFNFCIKTKRVPGRILLEIMSEKVSNGDLLKIEKILSEIFGIANFSFAKKISQDIDILKKECWKLIKLKILSSEKTFRITTQRLNKNFLMTSEEINKEIGGYIFEKLKNKKLNPRVNLKNPDIECFIEIINKWAFIFLKKKMGLNGMPVGTGGRALAMLSGGIDSPVAAYYGLKRGVKIDFIHFHSLPYTSSASNEKVISLAKKLSKFQEFGKVFMVPFAEIQQEIIIKCPEKLRVIMYRRLMLKIAEKIAQKNKYLALYSGESVAQVASQTLENILATNSAVNITIMRPLCGFDKAEIIKIAKKIETYDISILPHEDCCTRFIPKHPEIHAKLESVIMAEKNINLNEVIKKAIKKTEIISI